MDAVFYMSFYSFYKPDNDDEPVSRHLGFCISHATRPWKDLSEDIYKCEDQLENAYGSFSWLSGPTGNSNGLNLFGYEAYGVDTCQYDELMEQWRQAFLRIDPGCVVSDVLVLDLDALTPTRFKLASKTVEIVQHVQHVYQQHQAQQQRTTLNQQVAGRGSVPPLKKL